MFNAPAEVLRYLCELLEVIFVHSEAGAFNVHEDIVMHPW